MVEPPLWEKLWPCCREILCGHTDSHWWSEWMVNVPHSVCYYTLHPEKKLRSTQLQHPSYNLSLWLTILLLYVIYLTLLIQHYSMHSTNTSKCGCVKKDYILCTVLLYFRCVGYLFQKVGKVAATSVGGGLLLLQVPLHQSGPMSKDQTIWWIFTLKCFFFLQVFFCFFSVDR